MVDREQDIFLQQSRLNLVILNQHIFSDHFHRILFAWCPQSAQENFAESSAAYLRFKLKVFKSYVDLSCFSDPHCGALSDFIIQIFKSKESFLLALTR